jgi:hypothetical protein
MTQISHSPIPNDTCCPADGGARGFGAVCVIAAVRVAHAARIGTIVITTRKTIKT